MPPRTATLNTTGFPAGVLSLLGKLTPQQRAFALDSAEYVSGLCPRRAGKTFAAAVKTILWGFRRPDALVLYVALTKGQGTRIIWSTLKRFDKEFSLNLKFYESKHQVVFPNGSWVDIVGAERISEIEKIRGNPYDLVVIDEGRSYANAKLVEFLSEVIDPGLGDYEGTCALIGTPGRIPAGLFYEATTTGRTAVATFSVHHWSLSDNVAMPQLWERAQSKLTELGETPSFLVEYMGEWAQDPSDLVFRDFTPRPTSKEPERLALYCTPDAVGGVVVSESGGFHVIDAFREYFWSLESLLAAINKHSQNGKLPVYLGLDRVEKKFAAKLSEFLSRPVIRRDVLPHDLTVPFVADGLKRGEITITDSVLAKELAVLQYEEVEDRPTAGKTRQFAEQLDSAATESLLFAWSCSTYRYKKQANASKPNGPWYSDEEAFLKAAAEAKTERKRTRRGLYDLL